MTDGKLRGLERRWKETGDLEEEVAYLRERVRVGDLEEGRLRLAAYCGAQAAAMANQGQPVVLPESAEAWAKGLGPSLDPSDISGVPPWPGEFMAPPLYLVWDGLTPPACSSWNDAERFDAWVLGEIAPFAEEAAVRAFVAGLRDLVIPLYGTDAINPEAVDQTVERLEGWLVCPCETCKDKAWDAPLVEEYYWCHDLSFLLSVAGDRPEVDWLGAIRADLLPWLLGHGDPVRNRVEARKTAAS